MRLVSVLATLALASLVAWLIEPDIWLATLALLFGGGAAYKGVALLSASRWWRAVVGLSPAAGIVMLWVSQGRAFVLLLWLLALLPLRLAVRGLFTRQS